jgi:tRNA nucleotidyltransferase/poly(A) polymerase
MKVDDLKNIFSKMNFEFENDILIRKVLSKINDLKWFFVGGVVRDALLGYETYDIDITIQATPEEILERMKEFSTSIVGQRFGTIGVFIGKWKIELTSTRIDVKTFGRHAEVEFGGSFLQDSERRDFTFNSLLYRENEIIDFHDGIKDLYERKIKFIGNARQRIEEDYLRIIRYIRFFVRYGDLTTISQDDLLLLSENLHGLKHVSLERIMNEIVLMSKNINTKNAFELFNEIGISNFLWNQNLSLEFDENDMYFKKVARAFRKFKIKLPLNKEIRNLLETYQVFYKNKISNEFSYEKNIIFLWYKKGFESAKEYIETIYLDRIDYLFLLQKDWSKFENINLSFLNGFERGIAELNLRYNFLFKNEIEYQKGIF